MNMGTLQRYAAIYGALWRNSVTREMQFKSNFLLWIVVELLWFALQLAFMQVLYGQTDSIGGWSRWQVILLVGVSNFIQQLFTAIFLTNVNELSEHVRTGKLDFMLLLPVNTRFLISFRKVDLGSFINAAFAGVVILYAALQLDLHPSFLQFIGFAVVCVAGISVHYSIMFTVRAQGILTGYYNLFNIARLPEGAFQRGTFKAIFTFVLPMLLVANVPAKTLLGFPSMPSQVGLLMLMSFTCFSASELFWRWSLRRYTSASS
jgi:ABC-2 type transport system permease protein